MFAHTPLGLRGKHILERAFSGSTETGVQVGELKRPAGLLLFCDVTGGTSHFYWAADSIFKTTFSFDTQKGSSATWSGDLNPYIEPQR